MHTVELLPDPALDRHVRDLWHRLHRAGLRSLATHPHASNRPHVTLVGATSLAGLPPLGLPIPVELGAVRLLGRTLVRPLLPSAALSELHRRVFDAVGSENPLHAPGRWIPHVSLALNLPPQQHEPALELLAGLGTTAGELRAARSYDSVTRAVTEMI